MLLKFLQWLAIFAVLLWMLIYWQGGRKVVADIRKSMAEKDARLDTLLMLVITLFSTAMLITSLALNLTSLRGAWQANELLSLGGVIFVLSGVRGMFYSREYLGRFWTAEMTLDQGHQVIDHGPYAIVRHPIYTFAILMYLGLGLVFLTWWNALCLAAIVVAYVLKAREEDRFLAQRLPGYVAYQQRVRYRLLPGLW